MATKRTKGTKGAPATPRPAEVKRRPTIPVEMIEAALRQHYGTVAATARALGMNRPALQRRISKNKRLQEVVAEARTYLVDVAEISLADKVHKGEPWAIQFVLRRLGKARGYGDEMKLDITTGVDVTRLSDDELRAIVAKASDPQVAALATPDDEHPPIDP